MDDEYMDDEQSLSRSMSQMTTRGETTQPDEDTNNEASLLVCDSMICN